MTGPEVLDVARDAIFTLVIVAALKIREVAKAHSVPIVESPPLARALHATVDIDQEIPPEHYRAVAEIIGYLMKLRGQAAR